MISIYNPERLYLKCILRHHIIILVIYEIKCLFKFRQDYTLSNIYWQLIP